ncbi:MAG: hemerythrin [Pelagibacterium sp. SCN 63-23]|nr:MAG: hemerythrin [Pelagibacterium sp. SCN 63-23]
MAQDTTELPFIDVRTVPPRERHPRIFGMADALAVGESFVIVNDHDPRPLHYQLQAEYPGQFSWTYLESGPVVWRVELGRVAAA